jgi:hypothetical protein
MNIKNLKNSKDEKKFLKNKFIFGKIKKILKNNYLVELETNII